MTVTSVDITEQAVTVPAGTVAAGSPVWVQIRPNLRRSHSVATDVLAALGKRRDLSGKGRNQHEDLALAAAWLKANETAALVLVDAQHLGSLILRNICEMAAAADVHLWLLHRPPRTDPFMRAVTRRATDEKPLTAVPTATLRETRVRGHDLFPHVPLHDVHLFRAEVERTLPSPDRGRILALFDRSAKTAFAAFDVRGAEPATIRQLLDDILIDAPCDGRLLTQIRGIQLAAWHHSVHMRVDLDVLLNSEERPTLPACDVEENLIVYRQPHRIITCALTNRGYPLADIAGLRSQHLNADCSTLTLNGKPAPMPQIVQHALRVARDLADTRGDGMLIPHAQQTLAAVLSDASAELGLHIKGRRAERTRPKHVAYLRKFGIHVRPFA